MKIKNIIFTVGASLLVALSSSAFANVSATQLCKVTVHVNTAPASYNGAVFQLENSVTAATYSIGPVKSGSTEYFEVPCNTAYYVGATPLQTYSGQAIPAPGSWAYKDGQRAPDEIYLAQNPSSFTAIFPEDFVKQWSLPSANGTDE
jgi:hypothetical protein